MRTLINEVERFRRWTDAYPEAERLGEWELLYKRWPQVYGAHWQLLATAPCRQWSPGLADAVLYAIARDNETSTMIYDLARDPENLLCLAPRAVEVGERNAKWQFAMVLGRLQAQPERAIPLLLTLAHDDDEYVRRRALVALADIGSPLVEELVAGAWASGNEYQRTAVLYALNAIHSPMLAEYMRAAEVDGDALLIDFAHKLAADQPAES